MDDKRKMWPPPPPTPHLFKATSSTQFKPIFAFVMSSFDSKGKFRYD